MQCVGDIQVRFWAAFVEHRVSFPLSIHQVPFFVYDKATDVHPLIILQLDVELPAVVRPRSELDVAGLLVEGKPVEVQLAGGGQDVGRHPQDLTCAGHYDLGDKNVREESFKKASPVLFL